MKEKNRRWISWLYAAVLVMIAIAGVFYASSLKENSDPTANVQEYYAVDDKTPEVTTDLDLDIIDLGDIGTEVPMSDVSGD